MKFVKFILIKIIKAYQCVISPHFPNSCRFYPTCSTYSIEALKSFPLPKALYLSTKRILKCHPLHKGGFDPLPKIRK